MLYKHISPLGSFLEKICKIPDAVVSEFARFTYFCYPFSFIYEPCNFYCFSAKSTSFFLCNRASNKRLNSFEETIGSQQKIDCNLALPIFTAVYNYHTLGTEMRTSRLVKRSVTERNQHTESAFTSQSHQGTAAIWQLVLMVNSWQVRCGKCSRSGSWMIYAGQTSCRLSSPCTCLIRTSWVDAPHSV